jgi:hypothetical protein
MKVCINVKKKMTKKFDQMFFGKKKTLDLQKLKIMLQTFLY